MKLRRPSSPVEYGEAMEAPRTFAIAASREAFTILSSGLYNDKILAIIRELSCNAYDSHVAAGKKDIPFELHLPTFYEPFFSVKDFGIGLSHDEIMELYCTYFGTNKADSNSFVGALGLGSKSPFCYTEGFTVISRYNGTISIYTAVINEQGLPSVRMDDSYDDDDEPLFAISINNGLEVQFPVNKDDCPEFENKAKLALEFFDPMPKLNISRLRIPVQDYAACTKKWGLRRTEETHQTSKIRAIQGMVPYAIGNIDESRLNTLQAHICELPLDIFFPIGELSVAASRETLSNDERTIANILDMLDKIALEFTANVKTKLKECRTLWQARLQLHMLGQIPGLGELVKKAFSRGDYDGNYGAFTLSRNQPTLDEMEYNFAQISVFQQNWRTGENSKKIRLFLDFKTREKRRTELLSAAFKTNREYTREIEIDRDVLFVIGDIPYGGERFIHYFLQKAEDNRGKVRTIYLIHRGNAACEQKDVIFEARHMLTKLGNPPSILLSQLKAKYEKMIPHVEYASRGEIFTFNQQGNINRYRGEYERKGWLDAWEPFNVEDDELPDGIKFYVALKSMMPYETSFEFAEEFSNFISHVRKSGLFGITKDTPIYGLHKDCKLIKSSEWVEFPSFVWETLKTVMVPEMQSRVSLTINKFEHKLKDFVNHVSKHKLLLESPFGQFCARYEEALRGDNKQIEALAYVINTAVSMKKFHLNVEVDFKAEFQALLEAEYPILQMLGEAYYWPKNAKDLIIQYIQREDQRRELLRLEAQQVDRLVAKEEALQLTAGPEEKENVKVI